MHRADWQRGVSTDNRRPNLQQPRAHLQGPPRAGHTLRPLRTREACIPGSCPLRCCPMNHPPEATTKAKAEGSSRVPAGRRGKKGKRSPCLSELSSPRPLLVTAQDAPSPAPNPGQSSRVVGPGIHSTGSNITPQLPCLCSELPSLSSQIKPGRGWSESNICDIYWQPNKTQVETILK